jgi:hypothetical protein
VFHVYRDHCLPDISGSRTAMKQRVRMYGFDSVVRQPTQTGKACLSFASRFDGITWPTVLGLDSPTRWHVGAGVA